MIISITAWLCDEGTEHQCLIMGQAWPVRSTAAPLVTMTDANNAVHAEQRAGEMRCAEALSDKDAEIERLRSLLEGEWRAIVILAAMAGKEKVSATEWPMLDANAQALLRA